MKKPKIGVLKGGVSGEREVSLVSGTQAAEALRRKNFSVCEMDVVSSARDAVRESILKAGIDVAFVALHGEFGEDGGVQEILEEMGIAYTGSDPRASRLAMDKIASKNVFIRQGIPTPAYFIVEKTFGKIPPVAAFPKVVKPYYAGSSLGVSIVSGRRQLAAGLEAAFSINAKAIVEEFVEGRELTVGILDDRPLSVVEIIPKKGYYDFTAKYTDGFVEFSVPASLPGDIYGRVMDIALQAHFSLGCRGFSRVDLRLSKAGIPYVLEVNTIPGLTSHSLLPLSARACGIDFDSLIEIMMKGALRNATKQKEPQKV